MPPLRGLDLRGAFFYKDTIPTGFKRGLKDPKFPIKVRFCLGISAYFLSLAIPSDSANLSSVGGVLKSPCVLPIRDSDKKGIPTPENF